ncbi:hypothetical protein F5X96DRAFT_690299 [Biscogniauxia mediterranea]|nr:hypothetical protein F5X96DRAFT_690299 [Biscogniauxia mediterranea]
MAEVYKTAKDPDDTCIWNSSELRTAFDRILNHDQVSGCVVLFVDALDEYLGKDDEIARSPKEAAEFISGQVYAYQPVGDNEFCSDQKSNFLHQTAKDSVFTNPDVFAP